MNATLYGHGDPERLPSSLKESAFDPSSMVAGKLVSVVVCSEPDGTEKPEYKVEVS